MKKCWLFLFFVMLVTYTFGQDQISIKVSPGITYGRAYANPYTDAFGALGLALRGKVGAVYDWPIKENYYVSTGAFFVAKQIGIKNTEMNIIEERREIQYLQVPILLKLYTSEIVLDTRLYVELGFTGALKINDRITKLLESNQPITTLRMWEIGGLFGFGVEYSFSLFTSVFAGISYQPALSAILLQANENKNLPKLFGYADIVTIDFGIRF